MGRFFTPRRVWRGVYVSVCEWRLDVHTECCRFLFLSFTAQTILLFSIREATSCFWPLCPVGCLKIIKYCFLSPLHVSGTPMSLLPPAATVPLQNRCPDWRGVQRNDFLPRLKGKSLFNQSNPLFFILLLFCRVLKYLYTYSLVFGFLKCFYFSIIIFIIIGSFF